MNCFYRDPHGNQVGPFSIEEIQKKFLEGLLGTDTPIYVEDFRMKMSCSDFLDQYGTRSDSTENESLVERNPATRFSLLSFVWPFNAFEKLKSTDERKILAITLMGLFPLVVYTLSGGSPEVRESLWLTALYFSMLWGVFFYLAFPSPQIRLSTSVYCFFGTGLLSVTVLLFMYQIPPLNWLVKFSFSDDRLLSWTAFVLAVGLPEELCKMLMIYVLAKRKENYLPKTLAYYGLISGLGFGIYEGVDYQVGRNIELAGGEWGGYFILNLVRLTTTPLLHAVWTGITGCFLGIACVYPHRKTGLVVAGVGTASLLHGFYNVFSGTLASFGFAMLSVLVFSLYLAKSDSIKDPADSGS